MSYHQRDAVGVSASLTPPPPRCHSDEEEEDLNKAFDVPCFQQILCPAARSPPEKHRVYDEQDFEEHRHLSLHVHHPLSKAPADSRRKRTDEGRRGSGPSPATTIEEDREEEAGEEDSYSQTDGKELQKATPTSDPPTRSTNNSSPSPGCIMTGIAADDEAVTLASVDLDGIKNSAETCSRSPLS